MLKMRRFTLLPLMLAAVVLFLALPVLVQAQGRGRIIQVDITGTTTVQREDGSVHTIDLNGQMTVGVRGRQIVIDVIHAGVVRETGEQVNVQLTMAGGLQRAGRQVRFNANGLFTLVRADGSRLLADITGDGVITRQRARALGMELAGAGIVRGSGENIVIDVIHAGVISK